MTKHFNAALMMAGILTGMLGAQASACDGLRPGPEARVTAVIDGDSLLIDDGARVRLLGMQAPKLAQGRTDFDDWPLAEEAQAYLASLLVDQTVTFKYGQTETDRYGRLLAHTFVGGDQIWVQHEMIARGFARVYSLADNRLCLDDLYRAEAKARVDRLGIWADPFYAIHSAERVQRLSQRSGEFLLVEGAVRSVGQSSGRTYLNFGEDWDKDFTVVIEAPAARLFEAAGIDLAAFDGVLLRVRGWVENYGGPRIFVTHPEQMELMAR